MSAIISPVKARFIVIIASVFLLLLLSSFFLHGDASIAATPIAKTNIDSPSMNCWQVMSSPNKGTRTELRGVVEVGVNDVWAVGDYVQDPLIGTLIEHWNGTAWSIVPSPNPGARINFLWGVTAVSSDDVWAAGYYFIGWFTQTLIEHWNGSTWSVVSSVNYGGYPTVLTGITAISANDIWSVGGYYDSSGRIPSTFVEHWNGSVWSTVSSPNPSPDDDILVAVTAVSAQDVWAVGEARRGTESGHDTLIEHWNGTAWSVVPSPNPGISENHLYAVAAAGADDVWAAGYYNNANKYETLVERWDGRAWHTVATPNQAPLSILNGVAVAGANNVWVVGQNGQTLNNEGQTLIEHWNGRVWSIIPSQDIGAIDGLNGVAVGGRGDVWAVGLEVTGDPNPLGKTLVERFTTCADLSPTPTRSPTPTLVPPPCRGQRFTDVCPPDYFYPYVQILVTDGILSGYRTSPPCMNYLWAPCFNPYSSSTRGQISKVVSLAAGFNEPVSGQTFEDVPPGSAFYTYTQRMASRNIISGYPCGSLSEPCVPPANRPYFRVNNSVTRGQLSKMVSLGFGWTEPVTGQQFQDVPPENIFYSYVGRLYGRGIINGYPCGRPPASLCVPPDSLPYFLPGDNVTRGQTAKIVQLARTQPASTPTPTATLPPISTTTATATPSPTQTPTNPACQGIPPSPYMQISPGTHFTFVGSGFQPGETIRILLTAPDGTLFGAPFQIQADENGNAGPVSLNTDPSFPTGQWTLTMQGLTSGHQAIGYFVLLSPGYAPKQSH